MKKTSVAAALGGLLLTVFTAETAVAQGWQPGAELIGHSVRVETRGVVNTVFFDPGGSARILSDQGREYPAQWSVEGQSLCLSLAGGARECWAYQGPMQAGTAMQLSSTCGPSTWTAVSTAQPIMQQPEPPRAGERG